MTTPAASISTDARRSHPEAFSRVSQAARAAAVAAWMLASPLPASPAGGESWLLERREWTFVTAPGTEVSFENAWGNVYVRVGKPGEVYVLVNTQRDRADPRTFDLEAQKTDSGLALRAVSSSLGEVEAGSGWERRRADFTVFVPPGSPTRFATRSGLVELRGTREPTRVETETGEVRLRVEGPVEVRSTHGHVLVQFLRTDWEESAITTVTGRIRVVLPLGGSARAELETRGEITTDYSIEIDRSDPTRLKRGRLKTGEAGARLSLRSAQGPIQVVEMLVPEITSRDESSRGVWSDAE